MTQTTTRRTLYLLTLSVFLTGFSALLYQVVWQRLLGLFSGSDVRSVTIVTSAFLAGLGVGSLLGSFLADRFSSRGAVRAFGLCNLGIGLFAALSRFFYYDLLFRELNSLAEAPAALLIVVFVSLLVPTTLMGISLPLLSRAIVRNVNDAARLISLLYGINILGAGVGTVVSGWVLIGNFGYEVAVYIGAAMSLIVGLTAIVAAGRFSTADDIPQKEKTVSSLRQIPPAVWQWAGLVFISGFVAISLEIVWFRVLDVLLKSNAYTFAHVLSFFLVGDAAGNLIGSRLVHRISNPRRAFMWIQGLVVLYALVSVWAVTIAADYHPIATYIETGNIELTLTIGDNLVQWFSYFALPAVLMLPPAFLIGFYFPIVQKAVQTDAAVVGQRVGLVDMFNIIGNTLGGIVTGTVLLHFLGTSDSLRLLGLMGLAFSLVILWESKRIQPVAMLLAGVLAVMVIAFPNNDTLWSALHGADEDSRFLVAEDSSGVSAIREINGLGMLYANGRHQGNIPFNDNHILLGALPALVHPDPQNILVIGIGSAGTPNSVGVNPATTRITAVEIIGSEQAVLREYARVSQSGALTRFFADNRYEIIIGDGRRELEFAESRFDIIEADAIRPLSSHSGLLYSREYFEAAREQLAPGGIMAQWNPTERVEATFVTVFPYVIDVPPILLGSMQPIDYDVEAIRARLDDPAIRDYLVASDVDVSHLQDLIKPPEQVWSEDDPRDFASERINTDLFPRDEYFLNNGE
jgi:predicted membrane-bound spermidine synthase